MAKKGRVFSGARPTGKQHLGNYLGAMKNYVALQDDYECVYCIVDVHALTTVETTQDLKQNTLEMALDWLAAGMRPEELDHFCAVACSAGDGVAYLSFDGDSVGQVDRPADFQGEDSPTARKY